MKGTIRKSGKKIKLGKGNKRVGPVWGPRSEGRRANPDKKNSMKDKIARRGVYLHEIKREGEKRKISKVPVRRKFKHRKGVIRRGDKKQEKGERGRYR